jgi:hydrogenase maturation protease
MSDSERHGLLILGLGNVLCGDDGLGAAAVTRLARERRCPPGVCVEDGGTLGLSLMPLVETADDVILVDAVRADAAPGTLVRLEGADVPAAALERLSVHQVGVADLLGALAWRGHLPRRLVLLGLVPHTIELGLGRSPAVEAALPALIEAIVAEAARLGATLVPGPTHESDDGSADRCVDHVLGL